MGYRSSWLASHEYGSRHFETVLYAFDKEVPYDRPLDVLDVGVENGGSLEVWLSCLPLGSTVTGMDNNPECADLEYEVLVCNVEDERAVRKALKRRWFDVIIDSSQKNSSKFLWPFLRAGGVLLVEGYDEDQAIELIRTVRSDTDSWLPPEEIIRVSCYSHVLAVEKRTPRVNPYLEITQGEKFKVLPLEVMLSSGIRKVVE